MLVFVCLIGSRNKQEADAVAAGIEVEGIMDDTHSANPDYSGMKNTIDDIVSVIDEYYPRGTTRPEAIIDLMEHVGRAAMACPLQIDYNSAEVDRTADLVSAPLFTSSDYPWPMTKGRLCEPILQINLERFSRKSDREVGSGLLQVWELKTHGMIRIIPPEHIDSALLSEIPSVHADDYSIDFADNNELDDDRPVWFAQPGRIAGFGRPFLDVAPWHLRNLIVRMTERPDDEVSEEPPLLIARLAKIISEMPAELPEEIHRAFGMCGGNVFRQADALPPVLLTIEHDERVHTFDGSTFCVCYEDTGNGFKYSAHWFKE